MSAPKYCTPEAVATLLGRASDYFSASTTPTTTQVTELIERKSAEIEARTSRAWRVRTSTEELHDMRNSYKYGRGRRVYLRHTGVITPIASASGDSLKVWNGSTWEEWASSRTEGRDGDFWFNADSGYLYIVGAYAWHREDAIKITYRYNEGASASLNEGGTLADDATTVTVTSTTGFPNSGYAFIEDECVYFSSKTSTNLTVTRGARGTTAATHADGSEVYWVPDRIQNLCAKMVFRELLYGDDYSVTFPEGSANLTQGSKFERLTKEIEGELNTLQLWRTPE